MCCDSWGRKESAARVTKLTEGSQASLVVQTVKSLPAMQETQVQSLGL